MKAIALLSGGLDSALAAYLIKQQGIQVIGLNCTSLFSQGPEKRRIGNPARKLAEQLGIELRSVDYGDELMALVQEPRYGYGSSMNPCIDCRILSLIKAKEAMKEIGADFIITGEVVGQRPMSQRKQIIQLIERQAGLEGLVVRPLCAKILEASLPEQRGWVDRDRLLAVSGRGRKVQLALAQQLGLKDFLTPAGGCLLTDKDYGKKIKDLLRHEIFSKANVATLCCGRHFRIGSQTKLIVGRDQRENQILVSMAQKQDYLFEPSGGIKGPTALLQGRIDEGLMRLAGQIIGNYCSGTNSEVTLKAACCADGTSSILRCRPAGDSDVARYRI